MTIQITCPEIEALIRERLATGAFKDAEDVILAALESSAHRDRARGAKAPSRGSEPSVKSAGFHSEA